MEEQLRYYESQQYVPEDQLTAEEALGRGSFVRAHVIADRVDHAEVVIASETSKVVYYRERASAEIVEWHQHRYGQRPCEIRTPRRSEGDLQIAETHLYNAAGTLTEINRLIEGAGTMEEHRLLPDRSLFQTVEYVLNEDGDIELVRTRDGKGTILSEERA